MEDSEAVAVSQIEDLVTEIEPVAGPLMNSNCENPRCDDCQT